MRPHWPSLGSNNLRIHLKQNFKQFNRFLQTITETIIY